MKKIIALTLSMILIMCGCAQNMASGADNQSNQQTTEDGYFSDNENVQETGLEDNTDDLSGKAEISVADISDLKLLPVGEGECVDTSDYVYEPEFASLDSEGLQDYITDSFYTSLVKELDGTDGFVTSIESVYISQEYLDELVYNSKSNIFFGYTLQELDQQFEGQRYLFTLSDQGDTIVTTYDEYNVSYDRAIQNVSMGTGVIVLSLKIASSNFASDHPTVTLVFACAAATGTIAAVSVGSLAAVAAGIYTGIQTGNMNEAKNAAILAGSEGFKWGSIAGNVAGALYAGYKLYFTEDIVFTAEQIAHIQKVSGYSLRVIKIFQSMDEYSIFEAAGLFSEMINGGEALIRTDIDLSMLDELGRTNLQRMQLGLAPLDSSGEEYELLHIGDTVDSPLAILSKAEHEAAAVYDLVNELGIDTEAFIPIRQHFWKAVANYLVNIG